MKTGAIVSLRTVHQDTMRFAPHETIGKVVEGTEVRPNRIKIRVFRSYWGMRGATKGHLHELHRVSERIWITRIGYRINGDGTTNLPQVHEIAGELTDAEFAAKQATMLKVARANS